ncbi:haloacid dehalogenase-like hydrolase domain-containing protein 2 [Daphnia pulicaria]|uniref:haloacid dehalogenase-like hydrolase domain-containing protein 2 n=1 Tax=Daphnia pulicaria TaxID=35523 RepID=UPI001EEA7670|nr:haloacid dehalogenase-like hydrolase domain-containing protein 2 [Daphnia pulicaria]
MAKRLNCEAIKAVLVDLSGTLHIENEVTHGAVEALERLKGTDINVRFLTNTTKESKSYLYERLTKCGFTVEKNDIFTSLTVSRQYIENHHLNPLLLLEEAALEDFEGLQRSGEMNAVVVGLAPSKFDYETMNNAFRILMNGAELIAIHKGRYYSRGDGLALGPGPFVSALEFATGKTASVMGKPEKKFFLSALEGLNCEPHETIMIGDDVRDDVEGALLAGFKAILVRTGKYRPGDENRSSVPPTAVCDNFAAAVDYLLN